MQHLGHTKYRENSSVVTNLISSMRFLVLTSLSCRREGTRCQECVFVLCVCAFFFSRVSDDDADQAPSAERPFGCLADSLPICSAAFLLRIVLSCGVEQDFFFQTPHLFSEDTKTKRTIAESKCFTCHLFVGGGRVNSCMWLLFGHSAGCDRN